MLYEFDPECKRSDRPDQVRAKNKKCVKESTDITQPVKHTVGLSLYLGYAFSHLYIVGAELKFSVWVISSGPIIELSWLRGVKCHFGEALITILTKLEHRCLVEQPVLINVSCYPS